MSRSNQLETGLGPSIANLSFGVMQRYIHCAQRAGVGMLHTARSFAYYRKIFYRNQTSERVLNELRNKTVLDIGCGYTPYSNDSMFRACHDAGIDFYGIDPLIGTEISFGFKERALAMATGGSGLFTRDAPGLARALPATAQDLPFDDASVDDILSSYLLFVWIEDEDTLAAIFEEFYRVLKPGGTVRLFPLGDWRLLTFNSHRLREALSHFSIEQSLVFRPRVMSAMLTEMTRL